MYTFGCLATRRIKARFASKFSSCVGFVEAELAEVVCIVSLDRRHDRVPTY